MKKKNQKIERKQIKSKERKMIEQTKGEIDMKDTHKKNQNKRKDRKTK